jgi:hypothetical protein
MLAHLNTTKVFGITAYCKDGYEDFKEIKSRWTD